MKKTHHTKLELFFKYKVFGKLACYISCSHVFGADIRNFERTCSRCKREEIRYPIRNNRSMIIDFTEWKKRNKNDK